MRSKRLGRWMRAAVGVAVSRNLKVMRFGDNMREVAVTEGDKVEAQMKFGWEIAKANLTDDDPDVGVHNVVRFA